MIKLEAPLPVPVCVSFLPDPESSDVENLLNNMDIHRSMSGNKVYTYVRSTEQRRLTYEFRLTRMKGLELRAFIEAYYADQIRMTNHKSEIWLVKFVNNPFEFSGIGRAGPTEYVNIQLQLEGTKQ